MNWFFFLLAKAFLHSAKMPIALMVGSLSDDDREFLTALFLQYQRRLYAYARKLTTNKQNAEDAVNDALCSLIPVVPRLRAMDQRSLEAYIFVSIKNAVWGRWKKEQRRIKGEIAAATEADQQAETESIYDFPIDRVSHAVSQLSEHDQMLLWRKYYLRQSDKEIADQMGINANSVRKMVSRVRKRLMRILEEGGKHYD